MKNGGLLQAKTKIKTLYGETLYIRYNGNTAQYEIIKDCGLNGRFDAYYSHLFIPLDNFNNFIQAYKFLRDNKHAIY